MKKPNITEGEWSVVHIEEQQDVEGLWMPEKWYVSDGMNWICQLIHGKQKNYPANAQAISAVPEMMDALIEAYKAINSLDDKTLGMVRPAGQFEEYPAKYELIKNIREALKKAGVELDK